jgi:hypothetical protein
MACPVEPRLSGREGHDDFRRIAVDDGRSHREVLDVEVLGVVPRIGVQGAHLALRFLRVLADGVGQRLVEEALQQRLVLGPGEGVVALLMPRVELLDEVRGSSGSIRSRGRR